MSSNLQDTRRPRKNATYSREEMDVINIHKEEYRQQTTRELRANILKTKILVDLFNHWLKQGKAPQNEEDSLARMKELAAWVRNNWCPYSTTMEAKPKLKVNALHVVWQSHKPAVEEQLKELLGVDELDASHPGYFQQRNTAAKRVLDNMTEQEQEEIGRIVEERRSQGNPDNIRRERADRYREKHLQRWSKERWLDMGLATVIFTVHTDSQGKLVADVHDEVLGNMGLGGRQFTDKYENQVTEMQRSFLEFMKSTRQKVNENADGYGAELESESGAGAGVHAGVGADTRTRIKMTADGFPLLPDAVESVLPKKVCEALLRAYLSQHYYLASGKKHRRVPFASLKEDTEAFVRKEYKPDGLIIQDPRNMHRKTIQDLLRHCYERQGRLGAESAFRFALFIGSNRKRLFATYLETQQAEVMTEKRKDKGKGRRKDKGKEKQQDVGQLEGLLAFSGQDVTHSNQVRTGIPVPIPVPGPIPVVNQSDDFISIGMGDMVKLNQMGCDQIIGPINGPNEGLPEYQVRRSWFNQLQAGAGNHSIPSPVANRYPRPRPIVAQTRTQQAIPEPVIDPFLVGGVQEDNIDLVVPVERVSTPELATPAVASTLGKRNTVNHSPIKRPVTRGSKQRKVMTSDEIARLEAKKYMTEGKRNRQGKKRE